MSIIQVFLEQDRLAREAVELFIRQAAKATASHGLFTVALCGGNTPRDAYRMLAAPEYVSRVNWDAVHLFWGDERCVPPDDAQSNYRMARENLLECIPIPPEHVHRVRGEDPPEAAADAYEEMLRDFFIPRGWLRESAPRFDLVLLGMGTNGHTASLFPGSSALHEHSRWCVAQYVEAVGNWRITLTPDAINAAAHIVFLVEGDEKAETLRRVFSRPQEEDDLPATLIVPVNGTLTWLLDAAAASHLSRNYRPL